MIETTMGLKLPDENDFYNVGDFNHNFSKLETAIDSLTTNVNSLSTLVNSAVAQIGQISSSALSIVTGIMTSNGTMNLGFQPVAVFVFGTEMSSFIFGDSSSTRGFGDSYALALPGYTQRSVGGSTGTTTHTSLQITSNGFSTNGLVGQNHLTRSSAPSSTYPLKYVAFRVIS